MSGPPSSSERGTHIYGAGSDVTQGQSEHETCSTSHSANQSAIYDAYVPDMSRVSDLVRLVESSIDTELMVAKFVTPLRIAGVWIPHIGRNSNNQKTQHSDTGPGPVIGVSSF
jgi:hypothetical protein